MSLIKDINDLNFHLKSAVISLLLVAPFWYVDIYLLANHFYSTSPLQIPILLSFVLTIGTLVVTTVLSNQIGELREQPHDNEDLWTLTVIIAIITLMIASFVGYTFKIKLYYIICSVFAVYILLFVFLWIIIENISKKKK